MAAGELLIDRRRGDQIVCLRGSARVGNGGKEAPLELFAGQGVALASKVPPRVVEEFFPLRTHVWILPFINPVTDRGEFHSWVRSLLLALGDSKASLLAADALVMLGPEVCPLALDYLLQNRLLRTGGNYEAVARTLPELYAAHDGVPPQQVEKLFQLLSTTRRQNRRHVAQALQSASGIPSPVELSLWARPSKDRKAEAMWVQQWRAAWDKTREGQ